MDPAIAHLRAAARLLPSPGANSVALRSLVRHRKMLVQYRSAHVQHMQKALTVMNLRLTNVLSDITGVTGMQILRAIVAGERDGLALAVDARTCASTLSADDIAKSLQGNWRRRALCSR